MRYAVASNFEGGRAYFTGALSVDSEKGLTAVVDQSKEKAFSPLNHAAAQALADAMTDLFRVLPPFDARTWFVVELPDAGGYANQGLADLAGVIAGASGLPR
jgi:hypothetical protein